MNHGDILYNIWANNPYMSYCTFKQYLHTIKETEKSMPCLNGNVYLTRLFVIQLDVKITKYFLFINHAVLVSRGNCLMHFHYGTSDVAKYSLMHFSMAPVIVSCIKREKCYWILYII